MPQRPRFFIVLREIVPVLAVILAVLTVIGVAQPAFAQLFPFFDQGPQRQRGGYGGGFFGGGSDAPYFAPFGEPPRRVVREDYSRAPAPDKRAGATQQPERNIVVLGDAMADWLGYGLEDAYSEQPDVGIVRRHKTVSGLIRYQPKGDPADWPAAVKGVLAPESPAAIVIMLGLHDRVALREAAKTDKPGEKKEPAKPTAKPDGRDTDLPDDQAADSVDAPPSIIAPEKNARPASGSTDFREDRWVELYTKKIEDMIAAAKTKGVPVVWVGLPAVRGTKATSDMLFLNALYRDVAQKAGITYVDVWDGFVDEAGRYMQQGPDFEGQTRRLRSYDGVYFTKAGARKLAHYAERELNRLLAGRSAPVELPTEPEKQPEVEAKPGGPPPRPLWGPIVPLVVASVASDQLMGGPAAKTPSGDTQIARALIKGESLSPPPGRADDGVWPRREVGRETAPKGGEMPELVAMSADGITPVTATAATPPADAQKKRRPPQAQQASAPSGGGFDFFGLGGFSQPPQQAVQAQPRQPTRQYYQQGYPPGYQQRPYPQQPPQQQQQVRAPGLFGGGGGGPFGGFFSR